MSIYVDNIRAHASQIGEYDDFLWVVRAHEHAHAVIHLGTELDRTTAVLETLDSEGRTDWQTILKARTRYFEALDEASHEFLAQALTLAAIERIPDANRRERLRATFESLERRQPPHYVLPDEIKPIVHLVDWQLPIAAARGEADAFRGDGFEMVTGIQALALAVASSVRRAPLGAREWSVDLEDVQAVEGLRQLLEIEGRSKQSEDDALELLVDRIGSLRIEVFSREHPPPHFRVICGAGAGNYRISDCHQLSGDLRRENRVIRRWHAVHKSKLIAAWNDRRPSDCPVGEYRED